MKGCARVLVASVIGLFVAASASGQQSPSLYRAQERVQPPSNQMPRVLSEVGLDQRLDAQLPLELPFKDEQGRNVTLGDYFGKRPVILTLVYYECPMLCTQVLNGLTSSLRTLNFSIGKEFDIVTVSFDPGETPQLARAKKATYLDRYNRDGAGAGWHFLTGSQTSIEALTRSVGFRYAYNASVDQYAHVSAIMVLTPEGKLSRYFYGIEYAPRDVRLALIEAADHKIGTPVDQVFLYCFHYDPSSAKYTLSVMRILRGAGVLTVAAMVVGFVVLRRRERRQ